MSIRGTLLLWLGWVLMASRQAASQYGLDIDLSNKTLQHIPPDFPSNITKLTLSYNLINISEANIVTLKNYTKLTDLYLDNNIMTILPGHTFNSLSRLRILSVSGNKISRVEPRAFAGLGRLKKLDLSQNAIRSLPPGVFANLSSLESLSLQGNSLQSLESDIVTDLVKLKHIDLMDNPWNCSYAFLQLIKNWRVQISEGARCANPTDQAGKSILDKSKSSPGSTTTEPPQNNKPSSPQTIHMTTPGHISSNNSLEKAAPDAGDAPPAGHMWKFLAGVVVTALTTALLIVCAVKSPSWHKLLFNYRHQRLCEEEPSVFATGRYSNFSLDTEQTETSAHELDAQLDDEDGFIEDRYIETGDYGDAAEA
ncbi:leucine-rich repeat-containing protein 19-like [Megalops cyprinoides]|uniref:leucine-rich repeat-containing protein 19-like n=1 Tax=Megalops cyprinoides TaxID=118141 RepID=UPI001863EDD4|nr:leucine-rich repeat-containing protein 19-like [Megalops cyprinoides]